MLGRVVLQHVAPRGEVVWVHLLQRDALRARELLNVAADIQQVVVSRDRPETLATVVFFVPTDRLRVAQAAERRVREPVDVRVGVDDVDVRVLVKVDAVVAVGASAHRYTPSASVVPPANVVPTLRQ